MEVCIAFAGGLILGAYIMMDIMRKDSAKKSRKVE